MFRSKRAPYQTKAPVISQTVTLYAVDPVTHEKTPHCEVTNFVDHPLYLGSDVAYYAKKGYSIADIKRIWDWEWATLFAKESRPSRA